MERKGMKFLTSYTAVHNKSNTQSTLVESHARTLNMFRSGLDFWCLDHQAPRFSWG